MTTIGVCVSVRMCNTLVYLVFACVLRSVLSLSVCVCVWCYTVTESRWLKYLRLCPYLIIDDDNDDDDDAARGRGEDAADDYDSCTCHYYLIITLPLYRYCVTVLHNQRYNYTDSISD